MTEHKTSDPGRVIRTAPFRTVSGDYFAVLLSEWIPRYGWTVLIPVLATAGYGCLSHDERWLLVALMLVFIVAPMVMSFLYTYYMLAPEARRTILCKTVEIYPGSHISLRYVAPEEETPAGDDKKSRPTTVTTISSCHRPRLYLGVTWCVSETHRVFKSTSCAASGCSFFSFLTARSCSIVHLSVSELTEFVEFHLNAVRQFNLIT